MKDLATARCDIDKGSKNIPGEGENWSLLFENSNFLIIFSSCGII
jgi:hypothetical protein